MVIRRLAIRSGWSFRRAIERDAAAGLVASCWDCAGRSRDSGGCGQVFASPIAAGAACVVSSCA